MKIRIDDYIDEDVAYFLGLVIGRGTIMETEGLRQVIIQFPYSSLRLEGVSSSFNQKNAIQLGLNDIRDRLQELLDTDIKIVKKSGGMDFVICFMRNNMIWRNLLLMTEGYTSYPYFKIPPIFFEEDLPSDWKREFMRGFADVAGNIREANRYVDGRHRVRLDVLNYPTNWQFPVQLCTLLQEHLNVPVQLITWGHPNLNRKFREHQLNVFAKPFLEIGFSFDHKQKLLEEFAGSDKKNTKYALCPGKRDIRKHKPSDPDEDNAEKLDPALVGHHYDAYWQICKTLGCIRVPDKGLQMELDFIDETELEITESEE